MSKTNNTPWIDEKYITLVGGEIPLFRKIGDRKWNGRCPICGDSKKNPYKKRFYINWKENDYLVGCFNCNYRAPFWKFLKEIYPSIYKQYNTDKFLEKKQTEKNANVNRIKRKLIEYDKDNIQVETIETKVDLSDLVVLPVKEHDVSYQYLKERKIDSKYYKYFFYTNNWKKLLYKLKYEKWDAQPDDERLFVMLKNKNMEIKGIQGRCVDCSGANKRYMTHRFDDNENVYFFSDDEINYVVEGVYDALSIGNSVAVLTSDLSRAHVLNDDLIYIPDNEPNNKSIKKVYKKLINAGYKVFIPEKTWIYKDLNDAVIDIGKEAVLEYINSRIYSGLKAKMEFAKWIK